MMQPAEFITTVSEDKAIAQWTLESMRQITTALNRVTDRLDNVHEKLDAIGERVTRIEANRLEQEVQTIREQLKEVVASLDALESEKDRREGALNLGRFIVKSPLLGWLAMAAALLWAMLKDKS